MGLMLSIMTVYKVLLLRTVRSNQEHIHHSLHMSLLSRTVLLKMFCITYNQISREWDEVQMEKAIDGRVNEGMTIMHTAFHFGVPKNTLAGRMSGS